MHRVLIVTAIIALAVGCHGRTEVEDGSKKMLVQPKPTPEEEAAIEVWTEAMREYERLKRDAPQLSPAVSDLVHSVDFNDPDTGREFLKQVKGKSYQQVEQEQIAKRQADSP
jgi:hypothetical protein